MANPYGNFTTFVVRFGRVQGLERHLDRLRRDATLLFGQAPDLEAVRRQVIETAGMSGRPVICRVDVYNPEFSLAQPETESAPRTRVVLRQVEHQGTDATGGAALRLRLTHAKRSLPKVKHVSLAPALFARVRARRAGYDDCLFVDPITGAVLEGPTWSVGFVRSRPAGHEVVWPSAEDKLASVTRGLIQLPRDRVIEVTEASLGEYAAAFALDSGHGVRPIAAIGETKFDPRHPGIVEVTGRLAAAPWEAIL